MTTISIGADHAKFKRELEAVGNRMSKKIIRKALRRGGNVFRNTLRTSTPRGGTGVLRRSLATGNMRSRKRHVQGFVVYYRQGAKFGKERKTKLSRDAFYANWVEYGHKARDGSKVAGKGFVTNAYKKGTKRALSRFRRVVKLELARIK